MAKFKIKKSAVAEDGGETAPPMVKLVNMTHSVLSVPCYDKNGQVKNIHVRLQGRNGQEAPVIPSNAVTADARELERKGFIKILKAN